MATEATPDVDLTFRAEHGAMLEWLSEGGRRRGGGASVEYVYILTVKTYGPMQIAACRSLAVAKANAARMTDGHPLEWTVIASGIVEAYVEGTAVVRIAKAPLL